MTSNSLKPRGLARLTVLCLPVAAAVVLPSVALAATGGSTVRATIGGDGAVKTVKTYAANGSATAFDGSLPVKLSISRSVSGSSSTYSYHVENTFSKTQSVTYTDTAGKSHTTTAELQLPLVAQLGIELPKTFTNVTSPTGVVQIDPDGVSRVLFNLVLFSPLGAPSQDVTFTASGSGVPTAELAATAVNPASTAGLSQASQDATASGQQADFWASFASGGNGGLTQLADGVAKMVAGLNQLAPGAHQLADGIKAAGAGAVELDNGTKSAYDGSKKIATGTKDAHTGSGQLTTGLGQINTGQTALTAGLAQINGGLAQLDDKTPGKGLQAAVDGVKAIEAGIQQVLVGLQGAGGSVTAPKTIDGTTPSVLLGIAGAQQAVHNMIQPLFNDVVALKTLLATDATLQGVYGTDAAFKSALDQLLTDAGTDALPVNTPGQPAAGGVLAHVDAGLASLYTGVATITTGLNSHAPGTFGSTDKGGVDYGLLALLDPKAGLPAAVAGIDQLTTGSASALSGSQQLTAGSGQALTGSKALTSGLGQLETGTAQLADGLGKLSAGQHQVATGLPAAVKGSAQIADGTDALKTGAVQVHDGILAVQSGAVAPLLSQITTASQNAKKQLAILDAAGALAAQAPGGPGTAYVLSQSPLGYRLAAASSKASDSHTARNVGIGLGGLVALVIAVTAGFAIGRRSTVSA